MDRDLRCDPGAIARRRQVSGSVNDTEARHNARRGLTRSRRDAPAPRGGVASPRATVAAARKKMRAVVAALWCAALATAAAEKRCRRFVIISEQRSGSRYFIAKLDTHPNARGRAGRLAAASGRRDAAATP